MSVTEMEEVKLAYGRTGVFSCEIPTERILLDRAAPSGIENVSRTVEQALESPLDYPSLHHAILAGDRVVIAVDKVIPEVRPILAEIWKVLSSCGVSAENVLILQPAGADDSPRNDPRAAFPDALRDQFGWKIHDQSNAANSGYLATSAQGERLYLARDILDADFVITVGCVEFDPVIGYRGGGSVLFPGMSSEETARKAKGEGHRELSPDDERPFRQLIDEVTWLLGTQFTLQVVPGPGTGISHVVAGIIDAVFQQAKQKLREAWMISLPERPEIIVAAVDADAAGHGWNQVCAAVNSAANLISQGGKILLLTELNDKLGPGMEILRESVDPSEALPLLRSEMPTDFLQATQLINAVSRADVYLLSQLPSDLVEDLFMTPLENHREVQRLLSQPGKCVFLAGAQHSYCKLQEK